LWPPSRHAALLQVLLADPLLDCAVGRLWLQLEPDAIVLPQFAHMDGCLAANLSVCTALFRRRILDQVGGFDEDIRSGEDTDYFLRLMERNYRVVLCDTDTLIYRRHGTNATCDVEARENGFMQLLKRRRMRMSGRSKPGG
jgi:GT2 family glycosyltransferase